MNEIGPGMENRADEWNTARRPKAFSRRCARYVW